MEIILVISIVGIFSTVAVPKMARILDKVCLDYEMKHLYSDLNFARSLGKSSTFSGAGFPQVSDNQHKIEFWIYGQGYDTVSARNRYQIMRPSLNVTPYYRHNLSNDIEIRIIHGDSVKKISFDNKSYYYDLDNNSSNTVILRTKPDYESKIYHEAKIVFDSVGRWRGTYEK